VSRRVVRVIPDVPVLDKAFDYLVPEALGGQVRVGTRVRVPLHGRRVGGWVVEDGVVPPDGVALRPLAKVTGWGPPPDVVDLAGWAAWRWAGRRAPFLGTASPPVAVRSLPPPPAGRPAAAVAGGPVAALVDEALAVPGGRGVLRLPPAADLAAVALAAARTGDALVVAPSVAVAGAVAGALRRAGLPVALLPRDWARAAAGGCTVVGARAAAWAPVPRLTAVVVLDEHDEAHQEERAPTWHARDVGAERARRAGVPCLLVSPCPTLEALAWGTLVAPARSDERAGWPVVDVVDRRREDPVRAGLYSRRLVAALRGGGRVVCVLNRTGRARLLACASCGTVARCERCGAAVVAPQAGLLRCLRCGTERPEVCLDCGAGRFKALRVGVSRARDELEALAGEPVAEVTAAGGEAGRARVVVGTEAVLHQVPSADVVAFLDMDQELLAPRYRAAEQALALLARAARVAGGREGGGRVMVQTRTPRSEVVESALHADPARLARAEDARRRELAFPPHAAIAAVSGPSAGAFVEALGSPVGVEVLGPTDGRWLLRAGDHPTLCDAIAATPRPGGRLRVEVDPLRV
jgi:primosomal protein N' (replication factor Y) (superfamily II helicase)